MKLLLDMNLSPAWVPVLEAEGWSATHWYSIGPVDASDVQIMEWAKERDYCVLTHDLDFSAILAATRAQGPSVVRIRGQDLSLQALSSTLIAVLRRHARALSEGAILTVDLRNARIRSLPLR